MRTMLFMAVILTVLACRSGSEPSTSEVAPPSIGPSEPAAEKAQEGKASSGKVTGGMGHGRHTVFGIEVPQGMSPAAGPPKVFRFEGAHGMAQVVSAIRGQISALKEAEEGDGVLFRFASATTAAENKVPSALAIRIFRNEGRTVLDIWLEKEYATKLPDPGDRSAPPTAVSKTGSRVGVGAGTEAEVKARRQENLANTMRILRKLERNEPLTEEEKNSDLFN